MSFSFTDKLPLDNPIKVIWCQTTKCVFFSYIRNVMVHSENNIPINRGEKRVKKIYKDSII